ncbi:cytochrome P450 [Paenarthrobacter nitroguajacolicus]
MTSTPNITGSIEIPGFPMSRDTGCPFNPPPAQTVADAPIRKVRIWDGSTPWLVTRYAEVRRLLSDKRISSKPRLENGQLHPGFPFFSEAFKEDQRRGIPLDIFSLDDPEHARLRRMVTASFTLKRVEAMRPIIQRIVDELIDKLLEGPKPADLVQDLALPVSSLTICELLGVPYADHLFFQEQTEISTSRSASLTDVLGALDALRGYMDRLIDEKLANPDDGVMSSLVNERYKTGDISRDEVVEMGFVLLGAGHATTANMIALGTAALLDHPDQLATLRDMTDPKEIAAAVEELLRYLTIIHRGLQRVALEDIEIGGVTIKEGEGVIIALDGANRDAEVFGEPDQLDLRRDARQHVAFGFGVHACLGAPLARVELQVLYTTLLRRIPSLRAVKTAPELNFKHDQTAYGVIELPVSW